MVENLGANVHAWCERTGNGSSTYNLCRDCHDELTVNPHAFPAVLRPYNGDPVGVDGWGGDVEHPPYGEFEDDRCACCGALLDQDRDGYAT